ncbi:hypothetical protein HY450_03160, partial [Candidatus Pacearchaeota archaeon]|nr:hypothetical protein [Candidatus Pacearchaeota archaeon]
QDKRDFHLAVDAYGDAAKILEELETSFLRDRIKGLSIEQYDAKRELIKRRLGELHAKLYDRFRETQNGESQ